MKAKLLKKLRKKYYFKFVKRCWVGISLWSVAYCHKKKMIYNVARGEYPYPNSKIQTRESFDDFMRRLGYGKLVDKRKEKIANRRNLFDIKNTFDL